MEKEFYMQLRHTKNKGKEKVKMSAITSKVLITGAVLSMMISGVAPQNTVSASTTVSSTYEKNVNITLQVKETLKVLKNQVSVEELEKLAKEIQEISMNYFMVSEEEEEEMTEVVGSAKKYMGTLKVTSNIEEAVNKVNKEIAIFERMTQGLNSTVIISELNTTHKTNVKSPKTFSDIKKDNKYYTYITDLAKKGCIGGYSNGQFKASTAMSKGKFICILARAVDIEDREVDRAAKGKDYTSEVLKEAKSIGLLYGNEINQDNINDALTKEEMALYLSRAMTLLGTNKEISHAGDNCYDLASVRSVYKDAVVDMFENGIYQKGYFKPQNKVSRGEVVKAIYKVINPSKRSKVKVISEEERAENCKTITIKESDKKRVVLPKKGDTFITKSGKKVVLKSMTYGVNYIPGYDAKTFSQGVNLYEGMKKGKETMKDGMVGTIWVDSEGNDIMRFMGETLTVGTDFNGNRVSYYQNQWVSIANYEQHLADKIKNPKDGQRVGSFTEYDADMGLWYFTVMLK